MKKKKKLKVILILMLTICICYSFNNVGKAFASNIYSSIDLIPQHSTFTTFSTSVESTSLTNSYLNFNVVNNNQNFKYYSNLGFSNVYLYKDSQFNSYYMRDTSSTLSYNGYNLYFSLHYNEKNVFDSYSNYINEDFEELVNAIDTLFITFDFEYNSLLTGYKYSGYINSFKILFNDFSILNKYIPQMLSVEIFVLTDNLEFIQNYISIGSYVEYNNIQDLDAYYLGYNKGYADGKIGNYDYDIESNPDYMLGYTNGYEYGYLKGYKQGFNEGQKLTESNLNDLTNLFATILDFPFKFISNLLNFELFGINIFNIVKFFFTLLLIGFVIKIFI